MTTSNDKGQARIQAEDEEDSTDSSSQEEFSDSDDEEGATKNTHLIAVEHCRQIGSLYAFQIADAEVRNCAIRVDENMDIPTCTCAEGGGLCRHTQWLLEQLTLARDSSPTKRPVSPHAFIKSEGLEGVCKTLKWELRDGSEDDISEYPWALKRDFAVQGPEEEEGTHSREYIIRDLLATFTNTTTDDFRPDIFNTATSFTTNEEIYIPKDLEGTIARLLLQNNDFYNHFRTLIKPDVRATAYFQNQSHKFEQTLNKLDQYCDYGPSVAGGDFDLIWCAKTLTGIVSSITHNLTTRAPLATSSRTEAARVLVQILRTVVRSRNHDVYQNLAWPRPRKHGEPQIDRNLYQRLIGSSMSSSTSISTSSSSRPSSSGGGGGGGATLFVIDALQVLPEAKAFVDPLEEIYALLESVGWSAPKKYLEALRALIQRLKGGGSGPSPTGSGSGSGSGKRAAGSSSGLGGMERKSKRMK